MTSRVEARLQDLAQRDRIVRDALGERGETIREAIAAKQRAEDGHPGAPEVEIKGVFDWYVWDEYETGVFEYVETIKLRWVSGDSAKARLLEYVPDPATPFAFTTSDGRRIAPGRFLTDGGTIPDVATVVSGIDRYGYLPAYMVHDWEYVLHHCNKLPPEVTQAKGDRALLEALKTMMTCGLIAESRWDFWAIKTALEKFAARYWDADTPCSLDV